MDSLKCIACNKDINSNVKFCPYCGAAQSRSADKEILPLPESNDIRKSFEFVKLKKWLGLSRYGKSVTKIEINGNIMQVYQYQIFDPFIKYGKKNWRIPISDIQEIFSKTKINITGIIMVLLLLFFGHSDWRILAGIILVLAFLRSREVYIRTCSAVIPFQADMKDDNFKEFIEILNCNSKLNTFLKSIKILCSIHLI